MKTFHKLKMLYSLYKSLYNIEIQSFNFFQFWKTINNAVFISQRIWSPPAPLSAFERIKGSTVSERSLVLEREQGCWQTDQMERHVDKHVSSVSTLFFPTTTWERKLFRVRNKDTLSCFTINPTILYWLNKNRAELSLFFPNNTKKLECKKSI